MVCFVVPADRYNECILKFDPTLKRIQTQNKYVTSHWTRSNNTRECNYNLCPKAKQFFLQFSNNPCSYNSYINNATRLFFFRCCFVFLVINKLHISVHSKG